MGRLLHYAFEAALLSTAFSGAKRAAGVEFDARKIENETARTVLFQYFRIGDWVIDTSASQLRKHTDYFVPVVRK
ncbi:hypothetical protein PhCBS80983_g06058 [Powellomyces hirtus]|uniref:DUF1748-domain-containing protein n=1 Tax=Powellomyces hirtus TaxID=109895 RepID=A0A507DRK6_9FUNG|nr:hypothetical protein DFJ77DRAFT_472710 [Powellomyces hirtus]TPX54101.1 hypothetical protein PhCBS80983_g06058 [Powellomyces hirtus]